VCPASDHLWTSLTKASAGSCIVLDGELDGRRPVVAAPDVAGPVRPPGPARSTGSRLPSTRLVWIPEKSMIGALVFSSSPRTSSTAAVVNARAVTGRPAGPTCCLVAGRSLLTRPLAVPSIRLRTAFRAPSRTVHPRCGRGS
jgi:hypothetical protein